MKKRLILILIILIIATGFPSYSFADAIINNDSKHTVDVFPDMISLKYNDNSVPLADYTDYDTLQVGTYVCASMASAKTMRNCPVLAAHRIFCFETYNSDNVVQILMSNREIWFRYIGETWVKIEAKEPDYPRYYESYLLEKEEIIRNRIMNAGSQSDSFALITDIHWGPRNQKHSPALLEHISKTTPLGKLIMLGDYYATDEISKAAKNISNVLNIFTNLGFESFAAVGNHDYNQSTISGIETFTEEQLYPLIMTHLIGNPNVVADQLTCSFFVDNKNLRTRYFFTNCNTSSSFDPDSYKWIFEQMENVPNGYRIAIFTHSGLSGPKGVDHQYAKYLTGALSALKNKTTYVFDTTIYDYSNVDADVLFVWSGHNHEDQVFTDNGIMCIVTTCDAGALECGNLERTEGTISEQAFDCATISMARNVMWLTRIGAGSDRIIHYEPVKVLDSTRLSSLLDGPVTWSVEDGNVISASDGVINKLAKGYSAVYAKSANGEIEVWNIVT